MSITEVINAEHSDTSIVKALAVLDCFRDGDRQLGVTDMARRTGIPKSTVHRLCCSLTVAGYLVRTEHRTYELGLAVFELGSAAITSLKVKIDASRFLQRLSMLSGETTHLAVLDDADVIYVDKIETLKSKKVPSRVGQRNPAHATALGKALLAGNRVALERVLTRAPLCAFTPNTITSPEGLRRELNECAPQGVFYDRQERTNDATCIASAARNQLGEVVAAISVCGPTDRMEDARIVQLAPLVREAANALSSHLGWAGRAAPDSVARRSP